ncbi:PREDICTED: uncharacterized protein LOC108359443 [Rhagoletis zephyria]|uniref:uncharacterized protein LOC108359443 n=1 Tax=Rhagoletis zephyria TaxID=28612 RepID=UPI0008117D51|nr:PREDICTED: uncharacterized protein LOC108359443 [Rhagoletis zephyria]
MMGLCCAMLTELEERLPVGYLMSHNHLCSHMYRIGISTETDCRLCTEHIMCDCPALARLRLQCFKSMPLRVRNHHSYTKDLLGRGVPFRYTQHIYITMRRASTGLNGFYN